MRTMRDQLVTRASSMRIWRVAVAIACAAGCASSRADAPRREPAEPPPVKRFERDMMIRFHMHESFDLLRAIERLLIRGKLEDAKLFAAAIAEAPDEPGLGPWTQHAMAVRAGAAALAQAKTVDEACKREAKLADACAGCHIDAGASPVFREHPTAPPDQPTIDARMVRHRWAADRMWEGIVGGDAQPWRAGLEVVAAAPLDWNALGPARAGFGRRLQQLALKARGRKPTNAPADRAAAYGEILATCAGCHMAANPPPR
jgi:cytochrome c553